LENIIPITGKINYQITLDPGVWIFDDRKVDLDTYFQETKATENELEKYTKSVSKHWDREIMEGAVFPPTLKTERKFEKQKLMEGNFGIVFEPFIKNAEPQDEATSLVIKHKDGELELSLEEAAKLILGFSKNGKPLTEDGPVYIYYGDGSNQQDPIKGVKEFHIK